MGGEPTAASVWHILKPLFIFPKGLVGGLVAASLMWMLVILSYSWHMVRSARDRGHIGPMAIAGGWEYLIQLPWVIVLLSGAFGVGFYIAIWWTARHP